jgi:hypothetical protein
MCFNILMFASHLKPASVIHIQLLHKESILEEEKILGVDGFRFVRRGENACQI